MSDSEKSSGSSGIGFCGALTILFIGLKLAHVIEWNWWWVLSPLWIGFLVLVLLIGLLIVLTVIRENIEMKRMKGKIDNIDSFPIDSHKSRFLSKLDEAIKASRDKDKSNGKA